MSEFNICMLGPSRCGKTTLLAAAVHEFMKFSEAVSKKDSEFIKLEPAKTAKAMINKSIDAIKASIPEGEFYTAALANTSEHTVYEFDIAYIKKKDNIVDPDFRLRFHDFPGAWIGAGDPRMNDIKFDEAQILIMPVDASLIYEAVRPRHKAWAAAQLEITSLTDVAKRWAQGRKEDKEHPGLFILAPVKCETYFNDNLPIGLMRDDSVKLREKIASHFDEMIKEIHEISPGTIAWYMPVDTVGCCYINDKN